MTKLPPRAPGGHNVADLLLREGLITHDQLEAAIAQQRETDQPIVRILMESGALDETKRLNFFKRQFGVPMISLASVTIDPLLFTYIPSAIARKHHLVAIKSDRDSLLVAMEDPSDQVLLDDLRRIVGLRIKPVLATSAEISDALRGYPEERTEQNAIPRVEEFDSAIRFFRKAFLPLMSVGLLVVIFLALWNFKDFRDWVTNLTSASNRSGQIFNGFLYFFLTWGVWTIIMFEISGLVFQDAEWKDPEDIGEPRQGRKAMRRSLFFGWLGLDRFYLGYGRIGVLKACTLGLLGFWWLLDLLLLLQRKMPDAAGRPLQYY